jgi:hypothetical protein
VQLLSPGGDYWRLQSRAGEEWRGRDRFQPHLRACEGRTDAAAQAVSGDDDHLQAARSGACAGVGRAFRIALPARHAELAGTEAGNLQLFTTLRISAAITVSLIILLAGFGIFNVMTMSVLAKVKEIAILRSMGYRRGDISAIFLGKAR